MAAVTELIFSNDDITGLSSLDESRYSYNNNSGSSHSFKSRFILFSKHLHRKLCDVICNAILVHCTRYSCYGSVLSLLGFIGICRNVNLS